MISWFKKKRKDLPDFWVQYEKCFEQKLPDKIMDNRFVVLDTETTGFNFKKDRILCIGALPMINNEIEVADVLEVYISQEKFNPETVAIHGIIKNEKFETQTETHAIEKFLEYIGNSVLVAHHANFDITMINNALQRKNLPKLKNKVLDTMPLYRATRINSNFIDIHKNYSLDEVAENLNISVKDRHTAAGDAMITAIAFLKIVSKLNKNGNLSLKELFKIK